MKTSPEFYRRHLPHWHPENATFFITIRLANSMPEHVLKTLQEERRRELDAISHDLNNEEHLKQRSLIERKAFQRWDVALAKVDKGPHWLARPEIANLIAQALHHRHKTFYDLLAFCIMSNHAHVVFTTKQNDEGTYYPVKNILHSFKRFTARECNRLLGRNGQFWLHESYDHVVRDNDELMRIINYVIHNPVKAGLVENAEDWPWTYSCYR